MTNKNYESGRRFEYRVKQYLEKYGFLVMRTAGSHSPFDLMAVNTSWVLLIQCKYGAMVSKQTRETMRDYQDKYPVECIIAHAKKREPISFYSWEIVDSTKPSVKEWKKIDWV